MAALPGVLAGQCRVKGKDKANNIDVDIKGRYLAITVR